MSDLLREPPRWVQLTDDEDGLVVVQLDDGVALGAPWPGFGVQLAITVLLAAPDLDGQPGEQEAEQLVAWGQALVCALGDAGRVVATLTAGGVREHIAYLRSAALVDAWRTAPPRGLGAYESRIALVADPTWKGLREVAGLLADGEAPLVLPD